MPASNVLGFSEDVSSMTFAEGLAFIARTRRQLQRFDVALPGARDCRMTPASEERLHDILNELESDIFRLLKF